MLDDYRRLADQVAQQTVPNHQNHPCPKRPRPVLAGPTSIGRLGQQNLVIDSGKDLWVRLKAMSGLKYQELPLACSAMMSNFDDLRPP